MEKPKISVLISTYKRPKLFIRALNSIINQTLKDLEIIIMDDGSSDVTNSIIRGYAKKDKRIRWVRFDETSYLPAKRYNQLITLAQGEYIGLMFDDDVFLKNGYENLYNFYKDNEECAMVYGLTEAEHVNKRLKLKKIIFGFDWDYDLLKTRNILGNNTVLVKKDTFNKLGFHDEAEVIKRISDRDMWLRIGKKLKVKRLNKLVSKSTIGLPDSLGQTAYLDIAKIEEYQKSSNRQIPYKGYWSNLKKVLFISNNSNMKELGDSINKIECSWKSSNVDIGKNKEIVSLIKEGDVIILENRKFKFGLNKFIKENNKNIVYLDEFLKDKNLLETENIRDRLLLHLNSLFYNIK
ncbi:glycosyltransferase family 2 protein [bacterium]|nr:glycosyltransferase family 2 protein [bacterium]